MKEKPTKMFNRNENITDVLEKSEPVNIEAALNGKYKFIVSVNGKFVSRTPKGPNRFAIVDTPYVYTREAEAHEGARTFRGAKVIKEEV